MNHGIFLNGKLGVKGRNFDVSVRDRDAIYFSVVNICIGAS